MEEMKRGNDRPGVVAQTTVFRGSAASHDFDRHRQPADRSRFSQDFRSKLEVVQTIEAGKGQQIPELPE